jgi:hypothetical protein
MTLVTYIVMPSVLFKNTSFDYVSHHSIFGEVWYFYSIVPAPQFKWRLINE